MVAKVELRHSEHVFFYPFFLKSQINHLLKDDGQMLFIISFASLFSEISFARFASDCPIELALLKLCFPHDTQKVTPAGNSSPHP